MSSQRSDKVTITFRLATTADAPLLLAWRNDPVTRANSRRQHTLSWEELMEAAAGTTLETYVAEDAGVPVGSVRLVYQAGECELSWMVAPEKRRMGYGEAMVRAAVQVAKAPTLIAVIKPANAASLRIAESLGFQQIQERDGLLVWQLKKLRAEG